MKDDSGSYAVSTEQGSSASQMTAAKIMDVIYQDYGDAQDKQLTQYPLTPRSKWKMHQRKKTKSECPDIWIRLPRHKWPKSWSNGKSSRSS